MSTHLLLHTLSRMTFLVDRDAGQWTTYEASPGLLPLPLVNMVDRPYGRLFLVFKDAEAIHELLADTDPRFEVIVGLRCANPVLQGRDSTAMMNTRWLTRFFP